MSVLKVSIIASHPIQYHIPWYRLLAQHRRIALKVYFALLPTSEQQGAGFGVPFQWDIPMFEGYPWETLPNRAKSPSLDGFFHSSVPEIQTVLAETRPDVVIITGWHCLPLLQALWACVRLKIPRIVRGESNAMRQRKMWVQLLHRLLLSQYNAFLAIGKANREFYLHYGIDSETIFPCHYFVDNLRFQDQFQQLSSERESLRARWNIDRSQTCFIYAGKLEPKKRIMDLLEALIGARRVNPNISLLVVGSGELMEQAKNFTEEQQLPVTFTGFLNQTEITKAYVAGDCLVLPSDYGETWGLVVNEAMACGLPAIVSDRVGCGPDLVKNGVTGFVFPFGDIAALSKRMTDIASDDDILIHMGRNAREQIKAYSVEEAVEGTIRAIEFAASKRS